VFVCLILVQFSYYNSSIHSCSFDALFVCVCVLSLYSFHTTFSPFILVLLSFDAVNCRTITHFLCSSFCNFYFRFYGSFQCYGIFCCQSVSKERDAVLMNCEFFDTKEQTVMVTLIHLHFLIKRWNLLCRCFCWPRDSTRVLL
jgi:hypothetical protein